MLGFIKILYHWLCCADLFFDQVGCASSCRPSGYQKIMSTKMKPAPFKLPSPFDCMKVTSSQGSQGRCYAFCLTSSGKFVGYNFPNGYRIRNSYVEQFEKKLYFLECRSFKRKSKGLLAAMLPISKDKQYRTTKSCEGIFISDCDLVVVDGLTSCSPIHLKVHIFKKNMSVINFASEPNIHEAVPTYFHVAQLVSIDAVKLIYLNCILGDESLLHPFFRKQSYSHTTISHLPLDDEIEGSNFNCDIWFHFDFLQSSSTMSQIKFCSKKRFQLHSCSSVIKKTRTVGEYLPWSYQRNAADLVIVTSEYVPNIRLSELAPKSSVYLLPYKFEINEPIISFAPLTSSQFSYLKKLKTSFQIEEYRNCLEQLLTESGLNIVKVIRITPGRKILNKLSSCQIISSKHVDENQSTVGGVIVGHLPNASGVNFTSDLDNKVEATGIKGLYVMRLRKYVPDFSLPFGCISVFRGYQWPYSTDIPDDVFDLLANTYTGKGLIRNGVPHYGNFEMIGRRTSNQSTGSMIALAKETHNHEYYRQSMDSTLLPLLRGVINGLQQESLKVAYSCGEGLMSLYKRENNILNPMELCEQTIITQQHFCNVIHVDKSCYLPDEYSTKVINSCSLTNKESKYLKNLRHFLSNGDKLPKSTTCAWTLRSPCPKKSQMFQYFVGSSSGFAYDLSSYNIGELGTVGATFQSFMFEHCTSVPVWITANGSEISLTAYDEKNYNFAWGSNGAPGRKQK